MKTSIHKWLYAILFAMCCVNMLLFAKPSPQLGANVSVDDRQWVLCDPILPHEQETIWLMPEDGSFERKEFIRIKFYPPYTRFKEISLVIEHPEKCRIYAAEKQKNRILSAAYFPHNDNFDICLIFKGKKQIYEIHYSVPAKSISEEERHQWIDRFKHIEEASTISSEGLIINQIVAIRNNVPLDLPKQETFHHPVQNLSIALPKSWIFFEQVEETERFPGELQQISYAVFGRKDLLIHGNIAITKLPQKISYEQMEKNWKYTLHVLKKEGLNVLAEGSITSIDGLKGKFIVSTIGDDIVSKSFYMVNDQQYRVEIFTHSKNFKTVREDIFRYLKNFSVNKLDLSYQVKKLI